MTSQRLSNNCRMEGWLNAVRSMKTPTVITCDFDGTLTPRYPDDESHFVHTRDTSSTVIQKLLEPRERVGGVCTSRAILEVERILQLGFCGQNGQSLAGLSAAENGAVIFCSRLSEERETRLRNAGYKVEGARSDLTIINLAKVSPDMLRDQVVHPALQQVGLDDSQWSSSVGNNDNRECFKRLYEMSKHCDPQRTHDACVRFGSAYVKVFDSPEGRSFVDALRSFAEKADVLCLVTPPLDGHPIWTADLGGGVTKYDAMRSMSRIYSTLAGVPEQDIRFVYFGDGENDLPAFKYVSERPGNNRAYLLDIPHGGNDDRAQRVVEGTVYLKGLFDIEGVASGVRQFCEE